MLLVKSIMITAFWVFCVLVSFMLLARYRTAAMIASGFVLVVLYLRIVSLSYIDFWGPVYAEQLYIYVGGSGASMPFLALAVMLFLFALVVVFRPYNIRNKLIYSFIVNPYAVYLSKAFFIFSVVFIALLYADMFRRGVIPLLVGMERYDYASLYAGPLHHLVIQHGFLIASLWGAFFVYPRLTGNFFAYKFAAFLLPLLIYLLLTGNRFSAFFHFIAFFLLPVSSVYLLKSIYRLPSLPPKKSFIKKVIECKATRWISYAGVICMIYFAIFNSLTQVRKYDEPEEKLRQRVLIQPAELWWVTWDRLIQKDDWTPGYAWNFMFVKPFDDNRNTGIQYLMVKALKGGRAEEILSLGGQYAGGYPEVFFELLGPYGALLIALLLCLITAMLLRLILISVCRGNIGTFFLGVYIYYGLSLIYIGGMLNFLINPIFWLKVLTLCFVFFVEDVFYRKRRERYLGFLDSKILLKN